MVAAACAQWVVLSSVDPCGSQNLSPGDSPCSASEPRRSMTALSVELLDAAESPQLCLGGINVPADSLELSFGACGNSREVKLTWMMQRGTSLRLRLLMRAERFEQTQDTGCGMMWSIMPAGWVWCRCVPNRAWPPFAARAILGCPEPAQP